MNTRGLSIKNVRKEGADGLSNADRREKGKGPCGCPQAST